MTLSRHVLRLREPSRPGPAEVPRRADGKFAGATLERVVVDELVAGLPVREFRWYKGRRHYSGWYWSSTMGRFVAYENRLELARVMLADQDRDVVAIAAQPFQLIGSDKGRTRRHVPDFLLVNGAGAVTVVDVKAADKMAEPSVREVFAWTRELAGWRGWGLGPGPALTGHCWTILGSRRLPQAVGHRGFVDPCGTRHCQAAVLGRCD